MSAEAVAKKRGRPKKAVGPDTIVILNSDAADIAETPTKTRRRTTSVKEETVQAPAVKRRVAKKVKAKTDDVEVEKSKTFSQRKSAKNVENATPKEESTIDVNASSIAVSAEATNLLVHNSSSIGITKPVEASSKSRDYSHNVQRGDKLPETTPGSQPDTVQLKQHIAEPTQSINQQQTIIVDEPRIDNQTGLADVASPSVATQSSLKRTDTTPVEPTDTIHIPQRQQQIEDLEATFLRGISELQTVDQEFRALSSRIKNSILFQSLQEKANQLAYNRVELASSINDLRLNRAKSELTELTKLLETVTFSNNTPETESIQSTTVIPSKSTFTVTRQSPHDITSEFPHSTPSSASSNQNTHPAVPQTTKAMPTTTTTQFSTTSASTPPTSQKSSSPSPQSKEPSKPIPRPTPSTFSPQTPPQSRPPPSQPLPPPPKRPTQQTLQELKKNPNFRRLSYSWTGLIVGIPIVIVLGRYLLDDLQKKQAERRQAATTESLSPLPSTSSMADQAVKNNIGVDSRRHGGVTSNGGV